MRAPPVVVAATSRLTSWRDERLEDPRHSERVAATLGLALGVSFTVCFLTGLVSHTIQHPPSWFEWGTRPAGLYRFTQGLHVMSGIASIPLLLAKLWSVFPQLFRWPPVRGVLHAIERLSLLPLIGGAVFMLVTGVANIDLWYPWPFFFPAGHYAVAWVTIGALIVHVGAKAAITRRALRRTTEPEPAVVDDGGRRAFLGLAAATSAGLVLVTVGQTVSPLRQLALLAPRHPDVGVQGFPVNKTAVEAGVQDTAEDSTYALSVESGGDAVATFTLEDLTAMPQRTATLPISCVEGWSANRRWTGVPMRTVLEAAGVTQAREVDVVSLQRGGRYRSSVVNAKVLDDDDTLLALRVDGETLELDHGYTVRLIAPNRPGVLQTKWVSRLVVS